MVRTRLGVSLDLQQMDKPPVENIRANHTNNSNLKMSSSRHGPVIILTFN